MVLMGTPGGGILTSSINVIQHIAARAVLPQAAQELSQVFPSVLKFFSGA
jgi:hypothetical protein